MFANIVDLCLSQSNPNGTCVKASLDGSGSAVWKITDCSDLSSKGFVCQSNQVMEEIGEGEKTSDFDKIMHTEFCIVIFFLELSLRTN
jgi:hypothetical protein